MIHILTSEERPPILRSKPSELGTRFIVFFVGRHRVGCLSCRLRRLAVGEGELPMHDLSQVPRGGDSALGCGVLWVGLLVACGRWTLGRCGGDV